MHVRKCDCRQCLSHRRSRKESSAQLPPPSPRIRAHLSLLDLTYALKLDGPEHCRTQGGRLVLSGSDLAPSGMGM